MDPWRYSTQGISVALRVTPRGGRDDIDGLETLANGRTASRLKQIAVEGDPARLGDALRRLTAAKTVVTKTAETKD